MNTKKFKAMLFSCVIGVAGCNKIGNPSYMDGGGDREEDSKEKRRKIDDSYGDSKAGTSSAVAASQGSTIDYNKVLGNTLSSMKRLADATEQVAIRDQESVERAIKAAADSKVVAEAARKAADDAEKNTPGSGGGGDASTSTGMTCKAEDDKEKEFKLKFGEGGDTL